ncbi:MAG: hypothetical protein JWM02_721 [Frankiales bacterium]|nr:hypothetical protein [Frankiales bacterium]
MNQVILDRTQVQEEVAVALLDGSCDRPSTLPVVRLLPDTGVLLDALPGYWDAQLVATPADLVDAALVVTRTDDPETVRLLCDSLPAAHVLVLVSPGCPTETVVAVLEAGADGCLRGTNAAEVNGHLIAMERRVTLQARR